MNVNKYTTITIEKEIGLKIDILARKNKTSKAKIIKALVEKVEKRESKTFGNIFKGINSDMADFAKKKNLKKINLKDIRLENAYFDEI